MEPDVIVILVMFALIVPGLCTLGAVLLVGFWASGLGRPTRILVAGVSGPLVVVGMLTVVAMVEQGLGLIELIGVSAMSLIPVAVVGLPISYFATRKLDRLLVPTTTIFE